MARSTKANFGKNWHKLITCFMATTVLLMTTPPVIASTPLPGASELGSQQKLAAAKIPSAPQPKGGVRRGPRNRTIVSTKFSLPDNPSDSELASCIAFQEPLVPLSAAAVPGENASLAKAIKAFKAKNDLEDISDLTQFINANPKSRWTPSVEAITGNLRFMTGYLSDSLALWTSAWDAAKGEHGREQMAMASGAFANLVNLDARLGRQDELRKYFAEVVNRPFFGTDERKVNGARGGLQFMKFRPSKAYICGPAALSSILHLSGNAKDGDAILKKAESTSDGTTLAQVKGWADQIGLKYQMAKRSKGAPFVTPAVAHYSVDHFCAIIGKEGNRYHIQDPTFDSDSQIWVSAEALEAESDGYFLIPAADHLPTGWVPLSEEEAKTVRGKGTSTSHPAPPGHCYWECPDCRTDYQGMAKAFAISPQATLAIQDAPLHYSCPIGPATNFSVNYYDLEGGQPSGSFTWSNLGKDWSMNWVSYLTVTSGVATVRLRTGGIETDTGSGGVFPNNHFTHASLAGSGTSYTRTLPDGTVETFNKADTASPPHIFMTEVTDPQGNSCIITYDAKFRVTKVTDPLGQVSTFTYASTVTTNPGYYKIATITDPFSRQCSFTYDSTNALLLSITDQIGLVSKFSYDTSSSMITQMSTAYGTTSFYSYIPGAETYTPQGLKITYPDGTFSVIENWLDEAKSTFGWDRHATQLYPNEPGNPGNTTTFPNYTHCEKLKYCVDNLGGPEGTALQTVTHPLETLSPIFYQHPGQTNGADFSGTSDLPSQVTRSLGNEVVDITIGGTVTASDTIQVGVVSAASIFYTVLSGDTTSTIAANIAAAINASSGLRSYGVTSGVAGPILSVHSDNQLAVQYFATVSGGGSETATLKSHVVQTQIGTLSGTSIGTVGQNLFFYINLPNGSRQTYTHVITGTDTLSTIVADWIAQANADPVAIALGFVGTATGPVMSLVSYSPVIQTYAWGNGSSGNESLDFTNIRNGATELENFTYTPYGLVSQSIDSMGRTFSYSYAANNIDLLQKTETKGTDNFQIGAWTYNSKHCPLTYRDGSGDLTQNSYNYLGQLNQITDANGQVTTLNCPTTYTATVGGTVSNNHIQTLTVHDPDLFGGTESVTYTEHTGDTTSTIAAGLAAAINLDGSLQLIHVTATSQNNVITLSSNSVNATTYTKTVTGSITITISTAPVSLGYLTQINTPAGHLANTNISYDGFGRVFSVTDSEGYYKIFVYDAMDRLIETLYPDSSTEQTVWDRLDPVMTKDRIGRWSQKSFDSMDELSYEIDPLGRKTQYVWCTCGSLLNLTDPDGRVTSWQHDLQGRTTQKTLQDSTSTNYAYESWSSRLLSMTDALNQTKSFFYNPDNTPYQTNYTNAVNATAPITFLWDPNFKRMTSAQKNDWGIISYTYNPYIVSGGSTTYGGGMLQLVHNNVIANSDTSYSYDALGRITNRSINGSSNSESRTYDEISRVTRESNVLGTFGYAYVDQGTPPFDSDDRGTTRLASVSYPRFGQVTNYSWYPIVNDERLAQISNMVTTTSYPFSISEYDYRYDSAGQITQWQQLQNNNNLNYSLGYDQSGQLTSAQAASAGPAQAYLKQNYFSYDSASNRTSVESSSVNRMQIGGTVTTGDTLTITIHDAGLSGGHEVVNYVVQSGDTLSSITSGLAVAISSDRSLQAVGINAASNNSVMSIKSASSNTTTYSQSTSTGASETITIGVLTNFVVNAAISGSYYLPQPGDSFTITVRDVGLPSGAPQSVTYSAASGDTYNSVTANLAAAINANTSISGLGISATALGTVITLKSTSPNTTTYSQSTIATSSFTETISLSINQNCPQTIAIDGTKTTGDTVNIYVYDAAFGVTGASYTVLAGDTLTSIASGLTSAINANTHLQNIGASATSVGTIITFVSNSINPTTLRQTTSSSATETVALNIPANGTETVAIGGTKTSGNTLTVTVYDAGLTGGSQAVSYTVLSTDTLVSIASGLAAAISANFSLSAIGVTATSVSTVVNIKSTSVNSTTYQTSTSASATELLTLSPSAGVLRSTFNNVNQLTNINAGGQATVAANSNQPLASASISTSAVSLSVDPSTYSESTNAGATETITLGQYVSGTQTATIGGTSTTGDALTIAVENNALSGGVASATYTVPSGSPSTTTMATGVAAAINANAALQAVGVTATSASAVVTIAVNATTYTTTNGTTESLTVYPNVNGTSTVAVSGSPTTSDVVKITVHNAALSTGSTQISYTVLSNDTLPTIASALVSGINGNAGLQTLGVSANNQTPASLATALSFTESPTLAAGSNLVTVAGTNGDNLTSKNSYQVPLAGTAYTSSTNSGATETITFGPNTNGNSTITVGGTKTTGDQLTVTVYNPSLGAGPESVSYTVLSTDTLTTIATALTSLMNGDSKLLSLGMSVTSSGSIITTAINGGAGRTLTYDQNGNMTSDGTNNYVWDAENRLVQVTYPGSSNNSQFTYDPFSGLVKIVETVSGSVTSTKQFVRCGSNICEERDASSAITKQFFGRGQTLSGSNYTYTRDHLGSVRDVIDSSGVIQAHYEYGMFGEVTQTVGILASDFQYTGLYYHAPSGLNLATYRAYSPSLGRWINRDPIGEKGGLNLYDYVGNNPVGSLDPSGLGPTPIATPIATPTSIGPFPLAGDPNAGMIASGCVGLCGNLQGQGNLYPESARNTHCFLTEAEADAIKCCGKFKFSIQGNWNGAPPVGPGEVPSSSVNTATGQHWNYQSVWQGTYISAKAVGNSYEWIFRPEPYNGYPGEIWCVTCKK